MTELPDQIRDWTDWAALGDEARITLEETHARAEALRITEGPSPVRGSVRQRRSLAIAAAMFVFAAALGAVVFATRQSGDGVTTGPAQNGVDESTTTVHLGRAARLISVDQMSDPESAESAPRPWSQPMPLPSGARQEAVGRITTLPSQYRLTSIKRQDQGDPPATFATFERPDGAVVEVVQQDLRGADGPVPDSREALRAGTKTLPGGEAFTLENTRYRRTFHITPDGVFTVITIAFPTDRAEVPSFPRVDQFADQLGSKRILLDLDGE